jgi:hypothetical protein
LYLNTSISKKVFFSISEFLFDSGNQASSSSSQKILFRAGETFSSKFADEIRVARLFLLQNIQKRGKIYQITKWPQNVPTSRM